MGPDCCSIAYVFFFFQAEDGIRDLVRSRGLGDVYKRQRLSCVLWRAVALRRGDLLVDSHRAQVGRSGWACICLLYTSDAADERSSVDLGGRRIIKKKTSADIRGGGDIERTYLQKNSM